MSKTERQLSMQWLAESAKAFSSQQSNRIAMNASTRGVLEEVALNHSVISRADWNFRQEVPVGNITNQKRAGICWMFAGLNWLRKFTMKKAGIEDFEFSATYLVFFDKLEKTNRFLEDMIELRDRPLDDRVVLHLLKDPIGDGGEWHLLADLVEKYGLAPLAAMGDSTNRNDSALMNQVLGYKLREGACRIREAAGKGSSVKALRKLKMELMGTIHRILTILLGEVPTKFDFAFRNKKKKFFRDKNLTPQSFYQKWVGEDLGDYRVLMSAPLSDTPYGKTYCVERFQNVIDSRKGAFLNVPIENVRDCAVNMLKKKQPVLFTCDVTQASHRKEGILDTSLLDYGLLFSTDFTLDRKSRLEYRQSALTHAMVLVGHDVDHSSESRWKVENSWGPDAGHKGMFVMSDSWFLQYLFAILVHKKQLSKAQNKAFEVPPTVLAPWHPLS